METVSFMTGIIGLLIGALSLFGVTVSLQRRFSWRKVLEGVKKVSIEIENSKPNIIIGLADGAVPAAIIALNCGIEIMYFIDAPTEGRRHGRGVNLRLEGIPEHFKEDKSVLIVDNHIFTGIAAVEEIKRRGARDVRTCAIFQHSDPSRIHPPDYFGMNIKTGIIQIPWAYSSRHKTAFVATR